MSIVSSREVLPRTFSHRFGESPTAERRFNVTVSAPVNHQTVLDHLGIVHGSAHPEYGYLLCTEGSVTEPDKFHAEVVYRYAVPAGGTQAGGFSASPLSRRDVWAFSTGGVAVPALYYYEGSGNGTRKALMNTAGDFFEGAMTEESELRCTISGNRATFPVAQARAVTNAVNSDAFLGAAAHQWKCSGISGQQQTEIVSGTEINYYAITVELVYRESGWPLLLPNIGWHYIAQAGTGNAKKERCYVFRADSSDKVAAAQPLALNDDGSIRFNTDFTGSGAPSLLTRRVHKEVAFTPYFGTPPF